MKKHLLKTLMLAICLALTYNTAKAADQPDLTYTQNWSQTPASASNWFVSNASLASMTQSMTAREILSGAWRLYYLTGGSAYGGTAYAGMPVIGTSTVSGQGGKYLRANTPDVKASAVSTLGVENIDYQMSAIATLGKHVLVCNASNNLRIYDWGASETQKSQATVFSGTVNTTDWLGETMSTYGTWENGKVMFATNEDKMVYFNVTNGSFSSPNYINLKKNGQAYSLPSNRSRVQVQMESDGSFWINCAGVYPTHFSASGDFIETLPANLFDSSNGVGASFVTHKGHKYAVVINANSDKSSVNLRVIDYTNGAASAKKVCETPAQPISTAYGNANKESVSTTIIGNTLYVWLLIPNNLTAEYTVTLPDWAVETDVAPKNFSLGQQNWGLSNEQQHRAQLKWEAAKGHDHYELAYAIYSPSQATPGDENAWTKVDANVGADKAEYWHTVPMGRGRVVYRLRAIKSDGKQLGESLYLPVYNLPFGSIQLDATINDDASINLTWAPSWASDGLGNRPLENLGYKIIKRQEIFDRDGNKTVKDVQLGAGNGTSYKLTDFKVSETGANGERIQNKIIVRAVFSKTITLADGNHNTVESNAVTPHKTGAPYFTNVETFDGRNIASLTWTVDNNTDYRKSYTVYRDGIALEPADLRNGSIVDMDLPNGTHTYYVVLRWIDNKGNFVMDGGRSEEVSVTINRRSDVEQYGLEVIYNYPIVTSAEKAGTFAKYGDKVVEATGTFNNGKTKISGSGAPGDLWRQAQFKNGNWYLSKLTDEVTQDGKEYNSTSETGRIDIDSHISVKYMNGDHSGAIYKVNADDPRTIGSVTTKELSFYAMENQAVAIDESTSSVNIMARAAIADASKASISTDNTPTYANPRIGQTGAMNSNNVWWASNNRLRYTGPTERMVVKLGSNGNVCHDVWTMMKPAVAHSHGDVDGDGKYSMWDEMLYHDICMTAGKDPEQFYRVHYMTAGGDTKAGTGYVLMAPKYTNEVHRVYLNSDGSPKSADCLVARHADGSVADGSGSSENLAIPVRGKGGDFIHFLRGEGVFYVTKDGTYHTISTQDADINSPAGETFNFNGEQFFLHGVCTQSNNPGNFRVEIANNNHFTSLTPCASYTQTDEAAYETQGNSNANWYGTEVHEDEGFVYIYQYVPGVRFAKYKLYTYRNFPPVEPTVTTYVRTQKKDDGTGDEITDFAANPSWKHPVDASGDGYGLSENANYVVDHYEYRLYDAKNKDLDNKPSVPHNNNINAGNFSHDDMRYHQDWVKDFNREFDWSRITVAVRPVYKKKGTNEIIRGEEAYANHYPDYPASIQQITARSYKAHNREEWRVELDFNRAVMTADQYPHPVSYFMLKVSKDGGKTWEQLTDFRYNWLGGFQPAANNADEVGKSYVGVIPGDYMFGVEGESEMKTRYSDGYADAGRYKAPAMRLSDKYDFTNYKGKAISESKEPSVAWHYTTQNPSSWKYRAYAVYADGNPSIRKEVYTETGVTDSGITGVEQIGQDSHGSLSLYPQPAENDVTVNSTVEITSVEVYSLSGAKMMSVQGNGMHEMTLDVSALAPGMYVVRVNDLAPVRMIKK